MKTVLTLAPEMFIRNGLVFGTGRRFMYSVHGLPEWFSARIAEMNGTWKVLLRGKDAESWKGNYKSPEEALAGVAQELNLN